MISRKKLISVAAAMAISAVAVTADYLPLTSNAADEKWVMFGVTGFHANGASAGGLGGTDAGMFSITDNPRNVASDEGGDELYGEEGAVPTGTAMLDGTDVLASVKRVDGTAAPVYVRVTIAENDTINYHETDPVRTIYVKKDADDTEPLFAFSYKSILEGQTLEFSTTTSGTTDEAYRITINSENTYNNTAVGEYIPAVPASEGDDGAYLTAVADIVDYNFDGGPQGPNPLNSTKYLKVDHRDVAAADEYIRLYSYNPANGWLLNDSRNNQQQFDTLEKGKGYWGKMALDGARPAGLVLGSPSITADDYINGGIDEGWNLLAFNADNAELRAATTGLIVEVTGVGANAILSDASGNHTVIAPVSILSTPEVNAQSINQAVKEAKTNGSIPDTFNVVAVPIGGAFLAIMSDEKFTLFEVGAGDLGAPTTLNEDVPYDSVTLEDHTDLGDITTKGAMSKYGEYALVVKAENVAAGALLDVKCATAATETAVATSGLIAGTACIDTAIDLDTDYDGVVDNHILMVADEPFEVRDHTFTRVFDFTASADEGTLTFVNADAAVSTATIPAAQVNTYDLVLTGINLDYDTAGGNGTELQFIINADTVVAYTTVADATDADTIGAALDSTTITIDSLVYDMTYNVATDTLTLTAQTVVTYDNDITIGVNQPTDVDVDGLPTPPAAGVGPHAATQDGVGVTASDIVAFLNGVNGLVDTANIDDLNEQIIFRMNEANSNEFKVLETGLADSLTPSSTNNVLAKGAISDVFSPNYLVKAALKNTNTIALGDNVDPSATDTVSVTVTNTYSTSIVLDDYVLDAADEADANIFYPKLVSHINTQLDENGVDTTVAIVKTTTTVDDFDATVTFTGSDVIDVTAFDFLAGDVTDGVPTNVLGTPTITNGDITQDLKYNFVLSPNYVLDGPLYDMKEAGYTAKAMVTGTMNLDTDTMAWDSIDLSRKPSEWFLSQDYNLFTVDNAAGYWTYLETAAENPLTFDSASFTANHAQHFDQDGTTYNQVAGGIYVNVYGIDYNFDGEESARVVAIVGGSQVELSRQSGDTYTAQISSRELQEMVEGKEYDIQVVVADGIGNRIPATSTEVSVDFKKPSVPTVTLNRGTMDVTNDAEENVIKYYLFSGNIPATNTINAADAEITGGSYNLCTTYSKENTYDLRVVALDGSSLSTSNVSDAYMLDDYVPVFSNSAIVTDTAEVGPSIAASYYDVSCAGGDIADFPATSNINAFNVTTYTDNPVKVSYTPIAADSGSTRIHFVTNDDGNTASIAYALNYEGEIVFVELDGKLYSYTLPTGDAADNAEGSAVNLDTSATSLPNQNLDEE